MATEQRRQRSQTEVAILAYTALTAGANFDTARSLLSARHMLTDPFGTSALTRAINGCAIRVHDVVGPGVFEAIYNECLQYELKEAGLAFETGRVAPVVYKGVRLKTKYFLDLVVENTVAVELKSIEALLNVHRKQLLSQLRLTNLPVGLLINFNVELLSNGGIKRVVNAKYAAPAVTDVPVVGSQDPSSDFQDPK